MYIDTISVRLESLMHAVVSFARDVGEQSLIVTTHLQPEEADHVLDRMSRLGLGGAALTHHFQDSPRR